MLRPPAGVDVGGATNFDELRMLWNSVTGAHASLFENLHPVVSARENTKSRAADLRLIVGPLADTDAAGRICNALNAAKRYCRPATFEGQPLALVAPEPPRRPRAPERKAAPARPPGFSNP